MSEFTSQPWSSDEDVVNYARLGVDTIEVVEANCDSARFAEQMASIGEAGLAISGVQLTVRTFFISRMTPDLTACNDRVAGLRDPIEQPGPLAPEVPFISNTGATRRTIFPRRLGGLPPR